MKEDDVTILFDSLIDHAAMPLRRLEIPGCPKSW